MSTVSLDNAPGSSNMDRTVRYTYGHGAATMKATNISSPSACQRLVKALIAASLVASGGCAQLPRMHPSPAVKEVAQLGSAQSFSAPAAAPRNIEELQTRLAALRRQYAPFLESRPAALPARLRENQTPRSLPADGPPSASSHRVRPASRICRHSAGQSEKPAARF